MCLCGPNNVESAVQTDPMLLPYDSMIAEPKECWELLVSYFAQQHVTWCAIGISNSQHCYVCLHGA